MKAFANVATFPSFSSLRKMLFSHSNRLRVTDGNPGWCLPMTLAAFSPVSKAVWPVALWGNPGMSIVASVAVRRPLKGSAPSISFLKQVLKKGEGNRAKGFLLSSASPMPMPSMNSINTDMAGEVPLRRRVNRAAFRARLPVSLLPSRLRHLRDADFLSRNRAARQW